MKKIFLSFLFLAGSSTAIAGTIPASAKTRLELDCKANLGGTYASVTTVVIRDVLYKTPPATWDNNNSVLDVYLPNGSIQESTMDESNGNDPQQYRDSDPSANSSTGGRGLYYSAAARRVFLIQSASNQIGLPKRSYILTIGLMDNNGNMQTIFSKGTLNCIAK